MRSFKRIALLGRTCHFFLEFVNLAARAGLLAVKAAGVDKERPAYLVALLIDGSGGQ